MSTKSPIRNHDCIILLFLLVTLVVQLSAYEQGTYFLFDIRDDAAEIDSKGRITVAASLFKSKAVSTDPEIAKDEPKSEFESDILNFGTSSSDQESSTSKILEIKKKDTEKQSSFGESEPESTGFYFDY